MLCPLLKAGTQQVTQPGQWKPNCHSAQPTEHTSEGRLRSSGPQQWGTRPLSRECRFTQHESHNIAGDSQKAFKCLSFKVVSKAGGRLSEMCHEEFHPQNQQANRQKEAGKRQWKKMLWDFGKEKKKVVAREQNCHISETAQVDICGTLFSILQELTAFLGTYYFVCQKSQCL